MNAKTLQFSPNTTQLVTITGKHFRITNFTTDNIYVSNVAPVEPNTNINPADDNVIRIPRSNTTVIYDCNSSLYIFSVSGGRIEVVASDYLSSEGGPTYISKAIQNISSSELSALASTVLDVDFDVEETDSDIVLMANQLINVTSAGTAVFTYDVDDSPQAFAPSQTMIVGKQIITHIIPLELLAGRHNLTITQYSSSAIGTTALGDFKGVLSGPISGIDIDIPPNYNCIFKFSVMAGTFTFPQLSYISVADGTIYWGDGTSDIYSNASITHIYAEDGEYNITVTNPIIQLQGGCFQNRTDLLSAVLSDNLLRIGYAGTYIDGMYSFSGCTSLTSVKWSDNLSIIGRFSFNGSHINGVVKIDSNVTWLGQSAFQGCAYITKAIINCNIGVNESNIFRGCTSIVEAEINNSTVIPEMMFYLCSALTSVVIAPSVMNIGKYAFDGTSLTSVIISRDCVLGANAFPRGCTISYYD